MNPTLKRYLVSSVTTFVTMFLIALGAFISAEGVVEWTASFWFAAGTSAMRIAVKAVVEANIGNADK